MVELDTVKLFALEEEENDGFSGATEEDEENKEFDTDTEDEDEDGDESEEGGDDM